MWLGCTTLVEWFQKNSSICFLLEYILLNKFFVFCHWFLKYTVAAQTQEFALLLFDLILLGGEITLLLIHVEIYFMMIKENDESWYLVRLSKSSGAISIIFFQFWIFGCVQFNWRGNFYLVLLCYCYLTYMSAQKRYFCALFDLFPLQETKLTDFIFGTFVDSIISL